ncbi:MAG: DCL family protein [Magnetococcus sp. YQC-5]
MGRGKKVVLDSMIFDNQNQAKEFFKEMLNRYIPGEQVSTADAIHLGSLFKRHPEYASKLGSGVDHFEVMLAEFGTQCFCIVRTDEIKVDFSYIKCITQKLD